MRHYFFTTKNGSPGLALIMPHSPVSIVSAWTRSGSRYDPKGKEGLAHLYEHVMMKETRRSKNEIDRFVQLENNGISSNAATTIEFAYYHQTQLAEKTDISFAFMEDGIYTSRITEAIIASEKKHVINEMKEVSFDLTQRIAVISNRGLFVKSGIYNDVYGKTSSIRSISLQDLKQFQKEKYIPSKLRYIAIIPERKHLSAVSFLETVDNSAVRSSKDASPHVSPVIVEEKDASEAAFSLGFVTASIHHSKETIILHMIRDYLANTWTSRFIQLLRMKHRVAYWVDGETANFSDTGFLRFTWWMQPKFFKKIYPLMLNEIEEVKKKNISEKDLSQLKTIFISNFTKHVMNIEELLWFYGSQFALDARVHSVNDFIASIKKVTPQDIRIVASHYLIKERQSIAAVGGVVKTDLLSVL